MKYKKNVNVRCPLRMCFYFIAVPGNTYKWDPSLLRSVIVRADEDILNSVHLRTYAAWMSEVTYMVTVTQYEKNNMIAMEFRGENRKIIYHYEYYVTEEEIKGHLTTRIVCNVEFSGTTFLSKIWVFLTSPMIKFRIGRSLRRLHHFLKNQARAHSKKAVRRSGKKNQDYEFAQQELYREIDSEVEDDYYSDHAERLREKLKIFSAEPEQSSGANTSYQETYQEPEEQEYTPPSRGERDSRYYSHNDRYQNNPRDYTPEPDYRRNDEASSGRGGYIRQDNTGYNRAGAPYEQHRGPAQHHRGPYERYSNSDSTSQPYGNQPRSHGEPSGTHRGAAPYGAPTPQYGPQYGRQDRNNPKYRR